MKNWLADAIWMARDGYGAEDIAVKHQINREEAWRIVQTFGGRHEDPRLNRQIEPIGRLAAIFGRGRGTTGITPE